MATKATPKAAERVMRERKGIALRLAGATYEEIAEQLEMSESGAYRLVRRCLDRERARTEEDAETLRQVDLMRVERAILALWAQVKAGHLGAIDRLLRCLDIRAKYLGLYAPVTQQLQGPGGSALVPTIVVLPDNGRGDREGGESVADPDVMDGEGT